MNHAKFFHGVSYWLAHHTYANDVKSSTLRFNEGRAVAWLLVDPNRTKSFLSPPEKGASSIY